MNKKKHTNREFDPVSRKNIKTIENPTEFYDQHPTWSFSKCDFEHSEWSMPCHQECLSNLMIRLKALEGQQWKEILLDKSGRKNNTKNHAVPVRNIVKDAQKRLKEINLDDFDEIYSLTVTGIQRLWGVMVDGVFCVVWFDTKHEIFPSHKR